MGKKPALNNPPYDPSKDPELIRLDQQEQNLFSGLTQSVAKDAYNPYAAATPYSYDPKSTTNPNQNFERYYSHPSYNKLGFNPWQDNESRYNQEGSSWGDIWRATKSAGKLALTGFVSPLRSYSDIFGGDTFALDEDSAKEMRYQMAVGSSSRGGITGFASNLIANSGYTVGIVGEAIAETFALSAATSATGGIAGMGALARVGKLGKDLGKAVEVLGDLNKAREAFKDVNMAKSFYNAIKGLSPLQGTTEAIKTALQSENLTGLAKASTTFSGFWKDLQMANYTISEAKMEGASTRQDLEVQLIEDFRNRNGGKAPSFSELSEIKQAALDAGTKDMVWNIPTIFLTNKISFEPLLRSGNKIGESALRSGTKLIEKSGEGFVEATFKNRLFASLKPGNLGIAPFKYFKENFAEGIQETSQDILSGTLKDYYGKLYNNSAKNGHDYGVGENYSPSIWDALSKSTRDQFSGQGFETFASGFLMGGLLKIAGSPIKTTINGVREYKKTKSAYDENNIKALNGFYKDPLKYFSPGIINYSNAGQALGQQQQAEHEGDTKAWVDAENQNLTSAVLTSLDTKTFGVMLDKLKGIKQMSPEDIKQAYGVEGTEVLGKIDKIISRAEGIKQRYEDWNENYPNPFNPRQYKQGSEEYNQQALGYVSWEAAKKTAIFNSVNFDRNLERVKDIHNNIIGMMGTAKIPANDVTLLLKPSDIEHELHLLKDEVEIEKGNDVNPNRTLLASKKTKRDRLLKLYDELKSYYVGQSMSGAEGPLKEFKKTTKEQLYRAFSGYMNHLASSQTEVVHLGDPNIRLAFNNFLDVHQLNQENFQHVDAINILSNPEGFLEQYKRANKVLSDIYNKREDLWREGIKKVQDKVEDNAILQTLYDKGFVLSPENADKLLKKETPSEVFDINAKKLVDSRDPIKYAEFQEIIKNYLELKEEPVKEEAPQTKVEDLADRISRGEQLISPHDIEFYTNNKDQIEKVLSERRDEEKRVKLDLEEKFGKVKTGEELDALVDELLEDIRHSDLEVRQDIGLRGEYIKKAREKKELELAKGLTFENLKEGNVVSMVNSDYPDGGVIVKKGKNKLIVKIIGQDTKVTVNSDEVTKAIKRKEMESLEEVKATPEEKPVATANIKKADTFINNDREVLKKTLERALAHEAAFEKEFLETLGCQ